MIRDAVLIFAFTLAGLVIPRVVMELLKMGKPAASIVVLLAFSLNFIAFYVAGRFVRDRAKVLSHLIVVLVLVSLFWLAGLILAPDTAPLILVIREISIICGMGAGYLLATTGEEEEDSAEVDKPIQ